MTTRHLLGLALLSALIGQGTVQAQSAVQPGPPPAAPTPPPVAVPPPAATPAATSPPAAAPPAAPPPAVAPAAAPAAGPAAPPAEAPSLPPRAAPSGDEDLPASAPTLRTSATQVVTTALPREAGATAAPTTSGSSGLLRVSSAEVGAPGQLRMGLTGEYFDASNFLIYGDRDLRLLGTLALAFTPIRFLEVFGSVSGSANRNRRLCTSGPSGDVCTSEAGRNDPEVIKSYGDVTVGSKFAYPLAAGVSAGGELGLHFLSSVSGISFAPSATSVWLTALSTWDMREALRVPVRIHLNLGLYFDNSGEVQDYTGISRPSKAVSEFAYGIAKDRVRTGLGAEWIYDRYQQYVVLRPFAEYHLDMITADPDPAFNDYRPPECQGSSAGAGSMPCRDNRDQQWMTFGLRAQLPGGFTMAAALDAALHSVGFPYGPPLPPWNLVLGIAYPLDFSGPKLVTRTVTVERRVPTRMAEGSVAGKVVSTVGGAPIEGAIVAVPGRVKSRVATDPDGGFRTIALPAGLVELEVVAPGYEPGKVQTNVVAGQDATVTISLTPHPQKGRVSGKVTDDKGKPVAGATVHFAGPESAETRTDEAGAFSTALAGGAYVVRVEADHFLGKEMKTAVTNGQDQELTTAVRPRPTVARVVIREGKLTVRQVVTFKEGEPEIGPAAAGVLDELADALASHPEVKKVRIEAHWDSSLPRDKVQELTDEQAKAVASYLARQGVGEERLEAVGMGAQRPLVPNIGIAKLRNRRIEFHTVN